MFRLLTRRSNVLPRPAAGGRGDSGDTPVELKAPFVFVDSPRAVSLKDGDLELVEPHERYVDDLLAACQHPQTRKEMPAQARTTRDSLLSFLSQNPRGQALPDAARLIAPGYTFWMRLRPVPPDPRLAPLPITMGGSISLRIGHSTNLDFYLGHIGYHVLPPARGHHYAERACRLLLPLAKAHGHRQLWITCNPENLGSRRTCERLGAKLVEIVQVPRDNPLYSQGDRQKCRFRLDL